MNLSYLFRLVFLRKWWLLLPLMISPIFTVYLLLSAEPEYLSGAKLWVKEQSESSDLLRIERNGSHGDTHINVQSQIIMSNRTMEEVIKRTGLIIPPPSRSVLGLRRQAKGQATKETKAPSKIDALKSIHKSVHVNVVNPEILIISAHMNDPHLAQLVVSNVVDVYRENSLALVLDEIERHEKYLITQQERLDKEVNEQEQLLIDFESNHPEVAGGMGRAIQSPTYALETAQVGPVPLLARQLAELELKRNHLATTLESNSFELKSLDAEISAGRALLDSYLASLSIQAKQQVEHDKLSWSLDKLRESRAALQAEVMQIALSRGAKIAEASGITVLDQPSFDDERIAPKRKNALIGSIVLGLLGGLGLLVVVSLLDTVYRYPEEIEADLEVPVLATLPLIKRRRS